MKRLFCQHCGGDPARGSDMSWSVDLGRLAARPCPHNEGDRHRRQKYLTPLAENGKGVVQGSLLWRSNVGVHDSVWECWKSMFPIGARERFECAWLSWHVGGSHGFPSCVGTVATVEGMEETATWLRAKPGRMRDHHADQLDATAKAVRMVQNHGVAWWVAIRQHGAGVALPRWLVG